MYIEMSNSNLKLAKPETEVTTRRLSGVEAAAAGFDSAQPPDGRLVSVPGNTREKPGGKRVRLFVEDFLSVPALPAY